ncbi:MAG: DUF2304 domain-containing protein [Planctomycetaceae bacterium]|nr:DUF2304 domain-containing protein [Planctomycetaceae bacterium]
MNAFQVLTLSLLFLVGIRELWFLAKRRGRRWLVVLRLSIWASASLAIAYPSITTRIGRGADLVLYAIVLLFPLACFYFYARTARLERQLTELIRRDAIQNAEQGRGLTHEDNGKLPHSKSETRKQLDVPSPP